MCNRQRIECALANDAAEVAVRIARALERIGVEYAAGAASRAAPTASRATRGLDFAIRIHGYLRFWAERHGVGDLLDLATKQRSI